MKKPFLFGTSLFMVVLIAFVYFSQPIQAKADQPTLDYVTTSSSLEDVKAMITGMEALYIPVVFIIIGFICLAYCTLRNIQVPISYPSNTSLIDKCSDLGHYCFDHATESLKPVLYSVYEFVASGQVIDFTNISSTIPFLMVSVGKFFSAFGTWIGSSMITEVSEVGHGLINEFVETLQFTTAYQYSYIDQFTNVFNDSSAYEYVDTIGTFNGNYWGMSNSYYEGFVLQQIPTYLIVYQTNTYIKIYGYTLDNSGQNVIPALLGYFRCWWQYSTNRGGNVMPNLSTYSNVTWQYYDQSNVITLGLDGSGSVNYQYYDYDQIINELNTLSGLGINICQIENVPAQSIPVDQLKTIINPRELVTPWSDNVYTPTSDQVQVDIDNLANQLADNTAKLASLSDLIAAITNDQALTLSTAITDVQTINSAGTYNIPSMDNIWKYPQYFFDMLHGWGVFVKGCLGAVTVGDGGLSWLFYGGFVLLICGGIIGKILLG